MQSFSSIQSNSVLCGIDVARAKDYSPYFSLSFYQEEITPGSWQLARSCEEDDVASQRWWRRATAMAGWTRASFVPNARTRSGGTIPQTFCRPASTRKMNYIGTWWCRLLMVAPTIEIAATCVRILTRRHVCSAAGPTSFILSRARVLSSFSCLVAGSEEKEGAGNGEDWLHRILRTVGERTRTVLSFRIAF